MIVMVGTLLTLTWPLWITGAVLRILKRGPDRDLALPTPFMLLPILRAQLGAVQPWYMPAAAHIAALVLLYGCWQQKRNLARWAAIGCGGAAVCMQLSTTLT